MGRGDKDYLCVRCVIRADTRLVVLLRTLRGRLVTDAFGRWRIYLLCGLVNFLWSDTLCFILFYFVLFCFVLFYLVLVAVCLDWRCLLIINFDNSTSDSAQRHFHAEFDSKSHYAGIKVVKERKKSGRLKTRCEKAERTFNASQSVW